MTEVRTAQSQLETTRQEQQQVYSEELKKFETAKREAEQEIATLKKKTQEAQNQYDVLRHVMAQLEAGADVQGGTQMPQRLEQLRMVVATIHERQQQLALTEAQVTQTQAVFAARKAEVLQICLAS